MNFWDEANTTTSPDGCWLWTGRTNSGYGRLWYQGKDRRAHRLAWCLSNGRHIDTLTSSDVVRHTCDTPLCVNPSHLKLGTQLDNIRDRHEKGRTRAPDRDASGVAKLTTGDVRVVHYLRNEHQMTADDIACLVGVTRYTIARILRKQA